MSIKTAFTHCASSSLNIIKHVTEFEQYIHINSQVIFIENIPILVNRQDNYFLELS